MALARSNGLETEVAVAALFAVTLAVGYVTSRSWRERLAGKGSEQEMMARRRVIAAADEERRRVVRDLHDGAQQRLVDAMLVLKLALRRVEDADLEVRALVEQALRETQQANSELGDLAQGILPSVLARLGLKAALPALASRVAPARAVDVPDGRFPPAIEATAYFVVSEALTNAVTHASVRRVTVSVRVALGEMTVEVVDDGVGGAGARCSSGLFAFEDRVSALGGRLTVNSPRGDGTRVTAQLPLSMEDEASPAKPLQRRCAPDAAESSITARLR